MIWRFVLKICVIVLPVGLYWIYQIDLSDKDERFVEMQFHRIMKREIRDIEKDIENIS